MFKRVNAFIQDARLVDIPLSRPLLKLMCGGDLSDAVSRHRTCSSTCISHCSDDDLTPTEPMVVPPVDPWFVLLPPHVLFLCVFFLYTTHVHRYVSTLMMVILYYYVHVFQI